MKKVRFVRTLLSLVIAVLLLGMVCSFAGAQEESALLEIQRRGAIRVGWAVWYPYMFRDPKTNELAGATADVFEDLAETLGVEVEWIQDSWATLTAGIQARKFDITNFMTITLKRAESVAFTNAVAKHDFGILVKERYEPDVTSWKDMNRAGKKVGVTLGSATDALVTKRFTEAELVRLPTVPDLVMALMADKIDAYASDINSLVAIKEEREGLYVVPSTFGRNEVSFAIRQGDQIFLNWLNQYIRTRQLDGTLGRIVEEHGLDASYAVVAE